MSPILIGIAGPSGSGKTEIAGHMAHLLNGTVLSLDHYYLNFAGLSLEERALKNFDHPASIDWPLLEAQLSALRRGETILRPEYDFALHARRDALHAMEPAPVILVDGIFALNARIRRLYHAAVYVDLEDEVCYARRLARDVRERGRTPESVRHQYEQTVRPMCEQFILPTRSSADVVVRGDQRLSVSAAQILERLPQLSARD
jgi:uridine kinase